MCSASVQYDFFSASLILLSLRRSDRRLQLNSASASTRMPSGNSCMIAKEILKSKLPTQDAPTKLSTSMLTKASDATKATKLGGHWISMTDGNELLICANVTIKLSMRSKSIQNGLMRFQRLVSERRHRDASAADAPSASTNNTTRIGNDS